MLIACATNDNVNLIDDHFGDAQYFDIYHVTKDNYHLKESIVNNITSEKHADPLKAKQILKLLQSTGTELLVNKAFGANIKSVNKFLLPVIIRVDSITEIIKLIQNSFDYISDTLLNKNNVYLIIKDTLEVRSIETT